MKQFLSQKAIEFELLDKSRTYLFLKKTENEASVSGREVKVMGYCSLALKEIVFPEEYSVRSRKEIDGYRGKIHGFPIKEVPCYLIGQLGRDDGIDNIELSGKKMIDSAMYIS